MTWVSDEYRWIILAVQLLYNFAQYSLSAFTSEYMNGANSRGIPFPYRTRRVDTEKSTNSYMISHIHCS